MCGFGRSEFSVVSECGCYSYLKTLVLAMAWIILFERTQKENKYTKIVVLMHFFRKEQYIVSVVVL